MDNYKEVLKQARDEFKKAYKVDISIEEIDELHKGMVECIGICVRKGMNVQVPRIGNFLNGNTRHRKKMAKASVKELEELQDELPRIQLLKKEIEDRKERIELKRKSIKSEDGVNIERLLELSIFDEDEKSDIEKVLAEIQNNK